MDGNTTTPSTPAPGNNGPTLAEELAQCWKQLPNKEWFLVLFAAWLLLFQFLGNGTFGYINTPSLLYWMWHTYYNDQSDGQDSHGGFIPIVVLVLMWWKRKELLALPNRPWWPGILILVLSLVSHVLGYTIQQPRLSIVAMFLGIYGLMGLTWGPNWLRATFFPFFLFVFCIPIASLGEIITLPLRIMVVKIVQFICNTVLGMNIIREGTQLFNAAHTYNYDVVAACSGLRSLVAVVLLTVIYAFLNFDRYWKRIAMIASAFPLAVISNVLRMLLIVITAEVWGPKAGDYVHDSSIFSMLPYVPAIAGVLILGHYMREPEARVK